MSLNNGGGGGLEVSEDLATASTPARAAAESNLAAPHFCIDTFFKRQKTGTFLWGDHALYDTVCGYTSLVFFFFSVFFSTSVWRCLTFVISLEADFLFGLYLSLFFFFVYRITKKQN